MKTLLIIGAGPNQIPAIQRASNRGFNVFATDQDPEAEGFRLVNDYRIASTRDSKATVAAALELNQRRKIDGVMTMASESAVAVAEVAAALGLPGLSPAAADAATNKITRQRLFSAHRVPSPSHSSAATVDEAVRWADDTGWPVVVKPADSAGSRGVRKVGSAQEMEEAIREARQYSGISEVLLEEFLTGTEHSIEGVVIDGEVHWVGFSDRNYDNKEQYPPYFLEDGDSLPTLLPHDVVDEARRVATQAVRALRIDWGPVKGDLIVDRGVPKVLEMAARLSGDYFCYVTIPLHNGIDLLEIVIDLALGLPIDLGKLRPQFERGVALRYLWPSPGRVQEIRGLDEARAMSGVHFVKWEPRWRELGVGSIITRPTTMGERVGAVMVSAETRSEAIRLAEQARNSITISTDPVPEG